ncbi:hypothetical protein HOD30_01905 [Candidatus Peregrinibacteria bacterium]|jgi:hypothetical protein|nr:hypothetical protein [Candidatus Peregrinibacteria bacterium]MBT4631772.1 hypothetical protein [Candidatus Peregrinibacteria bacterium]MBT5516835.1 hypothetical protein [Candidatus Peregrinibacteria bacterium]MBT5824503.1 hypothetical protein [Candidatus Peregrinibacteria bacterium]
MEASQHGLEIDEFNLVNEIIRICDNLAPDIDKASLSEKADEIITADPSIGSRPDLIGKLQRMIDQVRVSVRAAVEAANSALKAIDPAAPPKEGFLGTIHSERSESLGVTRNEDGLRVGRYVKHGISSNFAGIKLTYISPEVQRWDLGGVETIAPRAFLQEEEFLVGGVIVIEGEAEKLMPFLEWKVTVFHYNRTDFSHSRRGHSVSATLEGIVFEAEVINSVSAPDESSS